MNRGCGSWPDAARTAFLSMFLMLSLGIWLTACGTEETKSASYELPAYVNDPSAPPETAKAYRAAIDYPDDFARIPCYCGCGDSARHESLQDCFISSIRGDEIKFSNHGAG